MLITELRITLFEFRYRMFSGELPVHFTFFFTSILLPAFNLPFNCVLFVKMPVAIESMWFDLSHI